jgi:hypothetical protein
VLLGTLYGLGHGKLCRDLGVDDKAGYAIREAVFEPIPRAAQLVERTKTIGKVHGCIFTVSGRIVPVDRQASYRATNYLVQGSAYDVLAEAMYAAEQAGLGDAIYWGMHDELVVSQSAAHDIERIMETPPDRLVEAAGRVPRAPYGHGGAGREVVCSMIVTQHVPGCSAFLSGLPCGCSRTELPDPPTNRGPKCGGCGARLERDRLFCGVCGLEPWPRERWTLVGRWPLMDNGDDKAYYYRIGNGHAGAAFLYTSDFSHRTYPPVTKIAATVPISSELLMTDDFNNLAQMLERHMAIALSREMDSLLIWGQSTPISDTERALRRLAKSIDYTTDRQIRKARRRARVVEWWRRLRWKLDGWIMDTPEDYDEEDY